MKDHTEGLLRANDCHVPIRDNELSPCHGPALGIITLFVSKHSGQ
jgi:hypothetical protein